MQFTKMHGIGNDYIFVNCFDQPVPEKPDLLAKVISDRNYGIGSDGLILILPSQIADAKMLIWNSDGSPAEMCGNGLRCVAKYVYDNLFPKMNLQIETVSGIHTAIIGKTSQQSTIVSVNMGQPVLDSSSIPTTLKGNLLFDIPIPVSSEIYLGNIVSFGNPHAVLFVNELNELPIEQIGPAVENHSYFPERINVEFVQLVNPSHLKMRVWERGSAETLACGSGACAAFAVSRLKGFVKNHVKIDLPGGSLQMEFDENHHVIMTGPAEKSFKGDWINQSHTPQSSHFDNFSNLERKKPAA